MPLEQTAIFICDNPACVGDGVNTPARATTDNSGEPPPGWIQFTGTSTVGATIASGTSFFHNVLCCGQWFQAVIAPYLVSIGATANGG